MEVSITCILHAKFFEKHVRILIPFTCDVLLIVFLQDHIITELPDVYQEELVDVDMQGS